MSQSAENLCVHQNDRVAVARPLPSVNDSPSAKSCTEYEGSTLRNQPLGENT